MHPIASVDSRLDLLPLRYGLGVLAELRDAFDLEGLRISMLVHTPSFELSSEMSVND